MILDFGKETVEIQDSFVIFTELEPKYTYDVQLLPCHKPRGFM